MLSVSVSAIGPTGATASAAIADGNLDQITDHGFVWAPVNIQGGPMTTNPGIVRLGKPTSTTFTADIRSGLLPSKSYNLRAFVTTAENTVYSVMTQFVSQGSTGPVIESISPLEFDAGDQLTITGKAFGKDAATTRVAFVMSSKTVDARVVSITDTKLVVEAPLVSPDIDGRIRISVFENSPVFSTAVVSRKVQKITGITVTDECSPVIITGVLLLSRGNPTSLVINDVTVNPLPPMTETSITLPKNFHTATTLNFRLVYGSFTATQTLNNPLRLGTYTSSVPTAIPASGTFLINGTSMPKCGTFTAANKVPGAAFEVTSVTESQVAVKLISSSSCPYLEIQLFHEGRLVHTTAPILPDVYTVTSVSRNSGRVGETIVVKGTGLFGAAIYLMGKDNPLSDAFGHLLTVVSSTDTELTVVISRPPPPIMTFNVFGLLVSKCGEYRNYPFALIP